MVKAAGVEVIADFEDLSDVAAYLAEGYTSTAADDEAIFVINDGAGTAYIYHFLESAGAASTISAAELSLVGIVSENAAAALVVGDIV